MVDCASDPCGYNAMCMDVDDTYVCYCEDGYRLNDNNGCDSKLISHTPVYLHHSLSLVSSRPLSLPPHSLLVSECPAGTWGMNCMNQCSCGTGNSCRNTDGTCICNSCFEGPSCQTRKLPKINFLVPFIYKTCCILHQPLMRDVSETSWKYLIRSVTIIIQHVLQVLLHAPCSP